MALCLNGGKMTKRCQKRKAVPSATDKYVGKRLRLRRSVLGISQQKLAKECDITFQQIQKYEQGTNRISAGRLWEFSTILEVPIDYFYKGLNRPNTLETTLQELSDAPQMIFEDNFFIEPENFEILCNYHKITNTQLKSHFRTFLKSLAQAFPHT